MRASQGVLSLVCLNKNDMDKHTFICDIITIYVNEQFVVISEFLDACKIVCHIEPIISWSTKKFARVIMSTTTTTIPNLVHICPRGACGQIGEIIKNLTKIILFLYSPFWELIYRSDQYTDFHVWWLKWCENARMYLFRVSSILHPI